MPNETRKSNKIQSKIRNNFGLKQTAPLPPVPWWHDYQCPTSALSKCPWHDSLLANQKGMYVWRDNYIRYSIITQKKERKKFKRTNYQRRQLMGTNFPLNLSQQSKSIFLSRQLTQLTKHCLSPCWDLLPLTLPRRRSNGIPWSCMMHLVSCYSGAPRAQSARVQSPIILENMVITWQYTARATDRTSVRTMGIPM